MSDVKWTEELERKMETLLQEIPPGAPMVPGERYLGTAIREIRRLRAEVKRLVEQGCDFDTTAALVKMTLERDHLRAALPAPLSAEERADLECLLWLAGIEAGRNSMRADAAQGADANAARVREKRARRAIATLRKLIGNAP